MITMPTDSAATSAHKRTRVRRVIAGAGALAVALLLSACHYVGSGTVTSATGHGPAAFNFNFNCPTGTNHYTGVLIYTDQAAHVSFQGTIDAYLPAPYLCGSTDVAPIGAFAGPYTARTTNGGGEFELLVQGATSANNRGYFSLKLMDGPYDGYTNTGPVTAGGIVGIND